MFYHMIVPLFAYLVIAQSQSLESFSSPNYPTSLTSPGILNWVIGSTQTITWNTALTTYNVTLWQQSLVNSRAAGAATNIASFVGNGAGLQSVQWVVQTYDLNLDDSNKFFFWVNHTGTNPDGFTSAFFNISQTSASSLSSSSLVASGSTSRITPGVTPTLLQSNGSASSGISSTVRAGLGVGLGIGIPLILLLGMIVGLQLVRARKFHQLARGAHQPPAYWEYQNSTKKPPTPPPRPIYEAPAEYPTNSSPRELPGSTAQPPTDSPSQNYQSS